MEIDCLRFVERFNEVKGLYLEIKAVIILAENIDNDKAAYLGSLNELRNTLDHLIRSLEYPQKMESEFSEAMEHLYRAGYDTYEILAMNLAEKIVSVVKNYSPEVLANVFPQYYKEINPRLLELQVELADTRAHKKLDPETGTKSFQPYATIIKELHTILKVTERITPELENEKSRLENLSINKKKEKRRDTVKSIAIGVGIAILGQIGFKYVYDRFIAVTNRPPAVSSPTTNSPAVKSTKSP
jgi:hypothetical protein